MHNLHFIIANGETQYDAIQQVENELDNFGDENNWYNINEMVNLKDLTQQQKDLVTWHLDNLNKSTSKDELEKLKSESDVLLSKVDNDSPHVYWQLSRKFEEIYYLLRVKTKYTIDNILNGNFNNFYEYQYDEYGITDLTYNYDEDTDNLYFIIVDMHS